MLQFHTVYCESMGAFWGRVGHVCWGWGVGVSRAHHWPRTASAVPFRSFTDTPSAPHPATEIVSHSFLFFATTNTHRTASQTLSCMFLPLCCSTPAHTLTRAHRNPQQPDVFLSASGDTTVRVWDLRQPAPTLVLPAHAYEVGGVRAGNVIHNFNRLSSHSRMLMQSRRAACMHGRVALTPQPPNRSEPCPTVFRPNLPYVRCSALHLAPYLA